MSFTLFFPKFGRIRICDFVPDYCRGSLATCQMVVLQMVFANLGGWQSILTHSRIARWCFAESDDTRQSLLRSKFSQKANNRMGKTLECHYVGMCRGCGWGAGGPFLIYPRWTLFCYKWFLF